MVYKLTPAYDNVLNMYEVLEGADLWDQAELMFYYLTEDAPRDVGLLKAIVDLLIMPRKKPKQSPRAFDFIQDSELIYAAFYQAYGIDLIEEQGKMHWWKFQALLQGLPSDTRFSEVVQIRLRPMPPPTKYNGEERAQIARLKAEYALEISEEERQANLQQGLRRMKEIMLAMAKRNEKS